MPTVPDRLRDRLADIKGTQHRLHAAHWSGVVHYRDGTGFPLHRTRWLFADCGYIEGVWAAIIA